MGMSASQARLIALTARMSDTEYEGQQINQQRLMLSNKMNEVYEMMCNMEVPTPPSKIDFKTEQYSGKIGGNNITVIPDESTGKPIAYQETKGSTVAATSGTTGGNLKIKLSEAELPKGERTDGVYDKVAEGETADFYVSEAEVTVVDLESLWIKTGEKYVYGEGTSDEATVYTKAEAEALGEYKTVPIYGHPTSIATTGDNQNAITYYTDSKCETAFTPKGQMVDINNAGNVVTKEENRNSFKKSDTRATHGQTCYISSTTANNICTVGVADKDTDSLSDEQISEIVSSGKYYVSDDGTSSRSLAASDFTNGVLNDGLEILEKNDQGKAYTDTTNNDTSGKKVTSADGKKVGTTMSYKDAKELDGFSTAWEALKHRYESTNKTESELAELFTVVNYGDGTFAFVMDTDLTDGDGSVQIYEVEQGTYKKRMEDGTYTVSRDTSGNINKITTTDGAVSALNTADAYDELAYDAAMASYTAEKAEYDQEQNRLNKQTSIYQRQDKQLELKLTRLDNERNALNTEIEAVKKVIQDAIDRGFKTFSG